jgi:Ca-activated chloride channel family protein
VVQERVEAQKAYEAARSEGRKAALVQQQRENVFVVSVASLLPSETVQVVIEYQQEVLFDGDAFRLRFPTVAADRYTPKGGVPAVADGSGAVPPRAGNNELTLAIDLRPGFVARPGRGDRGNSMSSHIRTSSRTSCAHNLRTTSIDQRNV